VDNQDLVLIAGGILMVLVILHGLWVKWRQRRQDISFDLVQSSDLNPDQDAESGVLPELPNGGARLISDALQEASLPSTPNDMVAQSDAGPDPSVQNTLSQDREGGQPRVGDAPSQPVTPDLFGSGDPLVTEKRSGPIQGEASSATPSEQATDTSQASELSEDALLIVAVMAKPDAVFRGTPLVEALRAQGLKFGEMSIFHRFGTAPEGRRFSVANAVEPGTFDLADLASLTTPGVTFFMQLPVPGDAQDTLDEMLAAARSVAETLDGDVKDNTMSALTGQTVEHFRQRIADYARKTLTRRSNQD